jgi:SAM-dependent MidA family methyltransferase
VEGCVLANEVLDSFPVHVLEVARRGDCREVYVDLQGDRFVEVLGPLSEDALADPSGRGAACLDAGNRFQVCLQLEEWFAQASRAMRRGCLFAFDYGDLEPSLWLRQPRGSVESPGPRPRLRKKRFRAGNGERTAPETPGSQVRDRTSIFPSCTRAS